MSELDRLNIAIKSLSNSGHELQFSSESISIDDIRPGQIRVLAATEESSPQLVLIGNVQSLKELALGFLSTENPSLLTDYDFAVSMGSNDSSKNLSVMSDYFGWIDFESLRKSKILGHVCRLCTETLSEIMIETGEPGLVIFSHDCFEMGYLKMQIAEPLWFYRVESFAQFEKFTVDPDNEIYEFRKLMNESELFNNYLDKNVNTFDISLIDEMSDETILAFQQEVLGRELSHAA